MEIQPTKLGTTKHNLPEWAEEKFASRSVQSEQRDVEDTALFDATYSINLVSSLSHVVDINRLLKMIMDLNDPTECDGSETEIVANISNHSDTFVSSRSAGR